MFDFLLDGEMNPAFESDNEDDSFNDAPLRKSTAPAIQSTVLPWKNGSYNTNDTTSGNNKTFSNAMSKPVKQQEFPPNWVASSAPTGDEPKSSTGKICKNCFFTSLYFDYLLKISKR